MKLHRLYRFALLVLAGGMVFQTTTGSCCPTQVAEEIALSALQAATPAITSMITDALLNAGQSGTS
jgi:hypothetical protein